MIFDNLSEMSHDLAECSKTSRLGRAFAWIQSHDLNALPLGKTEIEGDDIFVKVELTTCRAPDEALFERHEQYIDIQIALDGRERFEVAHGALKIEIPYSTERDIAFYSGEADLCGVLEPGTFALYRIGEAHKPALHFGEPRILKKAVFKVRGV